MNGTSLPQDTLLEIISVQQEIVEADLTLQDVMNVVAQAAARLTDAEAGVVELHEGESMVYRAGCGKAAGHVGVRLSVARSLSGLAVKLDTPLRCDDSELDDRVDRDATRRVGARSMVVTPLRHRDIALGALKVYSSRPRAFDHSATEILQLLVGIIGASIHRALEHERLTRRASHDVLTGLKTRDQLEEAIDGHIEKKQPFALVFIDLNDFKRINDECGHARGDEVLQTVAGRMISSLRSADVAARFGGDEFVILLDGINSADVAAGTLQRVLDRISDPIGGDGGRCGLTLISASAGIAVYPHDGRSADALLRLADARMYERKRGGLVM